MGQGGFLNLVNGTILEWHLVHHNHYQMNHWVFPPIIKAGEGKRIYIEWDEGLLTHTKDDAAEAVYELFGTGRQFEIQARANPFRIQIFYKSMDALHKSRGYVDLLGWRHNADVTFVMVERFGMFHSICL